MMILRHRAAPATGTFKSPTGLSARFYASMALTRHNKPFEPRNERLLLRAAKIGNYQSPYWVSAQDFEKKMFGEGVVLMPNETPVTLEVSVTTNKRTLYPDKDKITKQLAVVNFYNADQTSDPLAIAAVAKRWNPRVQKRNRSAGTYEEFESKANKAMNARGFSSPYWFRKYMLAEFGDNVKLREGARPVVLLKSPFPQAFRRKPRKEDPEDREKGDGGLELSKESAVAKIAPGATALEAVTKAPENLVPRRPQLFAFYNAEQCTHPEIVKAFAESISPRREWHLKTDDTEMLSGLTDPATQFVPLRSTEKERTLCSVHGVPRPLILMKGKAGKYECVADHYPCTARICTTHKKPREMDSLTTTDGKTWTCKPGTDSCGWGVCATHGIRPQNPYSLQETSPGIFSCWSQTECQHVLCSTYNVERHKNFCKPATTPGTWMSRAPFFVEEKRLCEAHRATRWTKNLEEMVGPEGKPRWVCKSGSMCQPYHIEKTAAAQKSAVAAPTTSNQRFILATPATGAMRRRALEELKRRKIDQDPDYVYNRYMHVPPWTTKYRGRKSRVKRHYHEWVYRMSMRKMRGGKKGFIPVISHRTFKLQEFRQPVLRPLSPMTKAVLEQMRNSGMRMTKQGWSARPARVHFLQLRREKNRYHSRAMTEEELAAKEQEEDDDDDEEEEDEDEEAEQ